MGMTHLIYRRLATVFNSCRCANDSLSIEHQGLYGFKLNRNRFLMLLEAKMPKIKALAYSVSVS